MCFFQFLGQKQTNKQKTAMKTAMYKIHTGDNVKTFSSYWLGS